MSQPKVAAGLAVVVCASQVHSDDDALMKPARVGRGQHLWRVQRASVCELEQTGQREGGAVGSAYRHLGAARAVMRCSKEAFFSRFGGFKISAARAGRPKRGLPGPTDCPQKPLASSRSLVAYGTVLLLRISAVHQRRGCAWEGKQHMSAAAAATTAAKSAHGSGGGSDDDTAVATPSQCCTATTAAVQRRRQKRAAVNRGPATAISTGRSIASCLASIVCIVLIKECVHSNVERRCATAGP